MAQEGDRTLRFSVRRCEENQRSRYKEPAATAAGSCSSRRVAAYRLTWRLAPPLTPAGGPSNRGGGGGGGGAINTGNSGDRGGNGGAGGNGGMSIAIEGGVQLIPSNCQRPRNVQSSTRGGMGTRRQLIGGILAAIASPITAVAFGQDTVNGTVLIFLDDLHIEFRNTPRLRAGLRQATERLLAAGRTIASACSTWC